MRLLPLFPDQAPQAPSFASCRASPDHHLEAHSDVTAHHLYSAPVPLGADVKPRQTAARHPAYSSPDHAGLSEGRLLQFRAQPTTNGSLYRH